MRGKIVQPGFHLADAVEMFGNPILVRPDIRADCGEERWLGIGMTKGRVAFVAFAQDSQDRIRIISLRKANREEREEYEEAIPFGLESS
jgi:hypothetical protein